MLQLNNQSPFAANIAVFPDHTGVDTLYVMAKATFNIGASWTLAEEQQAPVEVDDYWGEPGQSSLKSASDFHIGKPATDIVVQGNAIAKDQTSQNMLDVSVRVGQVGKALRVFGSRYWDNGMISSPENFQTMPLVYERAYGGSVGSEEDEATMDADPRNPVGVGFRGDAELVNGAPLPNIENPGDLINSADSKPQPAGFGFIAPFWQPRAGLAGTYDEKWKQERAPYLPSDFDARFLNVAHPDLVYPGYVSGGEPVHIANMHASGDIQFMLPKINLACQVNSKGGQTPLGFNLETVLIKPNDLQLSLTWRAAFRGEKNIRKVDSINLSLTR